MSIGIYVFLRIYFLGFGLSAFAQFRTHCPPSSVPHRYDLPDVGGLAWSALVLALPALLPVMCSLSGCAGVLGSPPLGYMGRAGGGVVDTSSRKNSKKAFSSPTHPLFSAQNTPTPIVNLKNSAQKQKDPYKGSVFCAILALQALKGRNL